MRRVVSEQSSEESNKMSGGGTPDVKTQEDTSDRTGGCNKMSGNKQYETRINASSGYWLCLLLPLAYLVNNFRYPKSSSSFEYQMLTIVSLALCLQSICIFMWISRVASQFLRLILIAIPIVCTSLAIQIALFQTAMVSFIWGTATTLTFNYVYFKLLRALPKSFTFGEASIAAQGLVLFLLNCAIRIPHFVQDPPVTSMGQMNAIMTTALLCLVVTLVLLYAFPLLRKPIVFYPLMVALVATVCTVPVTWDLPVVTLWNFIISDLRRIFIIVFYLGLVGVCVGTVSWRLSKAEKASTSIRKLFHILVVVVYIPGLLYQCTFLYIASGVALAITTVIETVRVIKVPPLYEALEKSFNVFADEKDCGLVALTPFYLLIGCSLPMWISPNSCTTTDNALQNMIPLMSGVLTVGIGDTAASAVGSTFGKVKWPNSNKSMEGTIANILSQALMVSLLVYLGFIHLNPLTRLTTGAAIVLSSLTEAFTDQVDNIVLPLIFYITCVPA